MMAGFAREAKPLDFRNWAREQSQGSHRENVRCIAFKGISKQSQKPIGSSVATPTSGLAAITVAVPKAAGQLTTSIADIGRAKKGRICRQILE